MKLHPCVVREKFKKLKREHRYLYTMISTFFIMSFIFVGFLIFLLPQALCVWCNTPDMIFTYFLVIPFLMGYAHYGIDCMFD